MTAGGLDSGGDRAAGTEPTRLRSRRGLVGVLAADAVARTGTRVSAIAIPWFVLVSTGSATLTGLTAFCELAPYVVVKALVGPMIDKIGPRPVSVFADIVSAVAIGFIPLLHAIGVLSFPVLLGLVAIAGAVRGPGDSAKSVFLPAVAERAEVPISRATGLAGTVERLASMLGPGIAGVVVATAGPTAAIAINAATFLVGAVIIVSTVPAGVHEQPDDDLTPEEVVEAASASYLQRLRQGLDFLRQEKLLRAIVTMIAVTNLLDAARSTVLLPVWTRAHGHGPALIGLIGSTFGAAAVIGSITAAVVAHRLPRRTTYLVGFLLAGPPQFIALAIAPPIPALLSVMALAGLGAGFINPVISAIFFERIPRRLLGRVGALADSVAWSGIPLGGLTGAGAIALVGLSPALLVGGAVYLVTTMRPVFIPAWNDMDRRTAAQVAGGGSAGSAAT